VGEKLYDDAGFPPDEPEPFPPPPFPPPPPPFPPPPPLRFSRIIPGRASVSRTESAVESEDGKADTIEVAHSAVRRTLNFIVMVGSG
jgi:hypothetical protein